MSSSKEQSFSVQPHPAKSNNPSDLAGRPSSGQGSNPQSEAGIFTSPGPQILSKDVLDQLEQPETREELRARTAELNKKK
ncbi:hypothetical protein BC827DRAFT_1183785 [Russula dissimulans]|nr:hypothetical protein BC827DRAFT_1183785 [Russula dissimulans]